jgi:hypothetical protein
MRKMGFLAVVVLAVVFAGCGPSGPKRYKVTGAVTWNGKPLPKGHIVFEPTDRSITPDAGDILDGKFETMVQAGSKTVQIRASREVPGAKFDPAMGAVPREQYIPPRYNDETTLQADIKPEGPNHFEYPLSDKR